MRRKMGFFIFGFSTCVFLFSLWIWLAHPQYRDESKFIGWTTLCLKQVWREERFFIWESEYWSSSAREVYWDTVRESLDPTRIQQTKPSIEEVFERMDDPACIQLYPL